MKADKMNYMQMWEQLKDERYSDLFINAIDEEIIGNPVLIKVSKRLDDIIARYSDADPSDEFEEFGDECADVLDEFMTRDTRNPVFKSMDDSRFLVVKALQIVKDGPNEDASPYGDPRLELLETIILHHFSYEPDQLKDSLSVIEQQIDKSERKDPSGTTFDKDTYDSHTIGKEQRF